MFKQLMTATVLCVSALGMMAANATSNGVYVTGQVGYAHRGNELKAAPDLSSIVTINKEAKSKMADLAGRFAIGYQFTQNWAVEFGYLQLGKQKYASTLTHTHTDTPFPPMLPIGDLQPIIPGTQITTTTSTQAMTLNQHAFDVVGKGIYPINDKFNVYAKAGMAYLVTNVTGDSVTNAKGDKTVSIIAPIAKHNWAPEAGIGLTYDITPNVFIDTSFTHIQPIGKNKPANIDFATVGLGYSFG